MYRLEEIILKKVINSTRNLLLLYVGQFYGYNKDR